MTKIYSVLFFVICPVKIRWWGKWIETWSFSKEISFGVLSSSSRAIPIKETKTSSCNSIKSNIKHIAYCIAYTLSPYRFRIFNLPFYLYSILFPKNIFFAKANQTPLTECYVPLAWKQKNKTTALAMEAYNQLHTIYIMFIDGGGQPAPHVTYWTLI